MICVKTYLLNLESRRDRLERMIPICGSMFCNYDIVKAKTFEEGVDDHLLKTATNKGEIGHLKSYISILESAISRPEDHFIILEDDAFFHPEFDAKFNQCFKEWVDSNGDLLYFGGWHVNKLLLHTENLVKMTNTLETTIAVWHKKLAIVVLPELKRMLEATDVVLTHYMENYNCYTSMKRMVWQIDDYSDIKGRFMEHSKYSL